MTAVEHDLGEVRRTGESVEIVFHRRLARPIEKVWAAITVPERLADWFARTEIQGERIRFIFPAPHSPVEGRIVASEPMRLFAWSWPNADGTDSVVRFELQPDGDGCRLTLTQSGLAPKDGAGNAAGWHAHLMALEDAADGSATPWSRLLDREQAVNAIYRARAPA